MRDSNGYPSEAALNKVTEWEWNDLEGCMVFVRSLWQYADCGYWDNDNGVYRISTGGWSGNEDLIEALRKNHVLWLVHWAQSRRGGHFILATREAQPADRDN